MALLLTLGTATMAIAADPDALTTTLDRLLGHERSTGGWNYELEGGPGSRPRPWTEVLRRAEDVAGPFGLATWDVVVIRSPGTPAGGLVLLEGWRRTGRAAYLAGARRAGDLLVAIQLPSGGWFSEMPIHGTTVAGWFRPWFRRTTIDDDVTPGATRLLLALAEATDDERYRAAASRAIDFLVRTQRPDGAWPLAWRPAWEAPLAPAYESWATINDGATPAALETLLVGARVLNRPELVVAARRAGDWLVRVRHPPPQAGWAQQYDADGVPAPARRFEPTALAAWETRHALEALVTLAAATGDVRYCAPVPAAVDWLLRSALRPGCWARFYALDTNVPIYLAADGTRVDDPARGRPAYNWTGDYGIPALLARLGALPSDWGAVPIETALPGDPGRCPGDALHPFNRESTRDPRALIARAGVLLGEGQAPPPNPCAGAGGA